MPSFIDLKQKPTDSNDIFFYTDDLAANYKGINMAWERMKSSGVKELILKNTADFAVESPDHVKKSFLEVENYTGNEKLQRMPSALSRLLEAVNENIEIYETHRETFEGFDAIEFANKFRQTKADKIARIKSELEANYQNASAPGEILAKLASIAERDIIRLEEKEDLADLLTQNWFPDVYKQSIDIKDFIHSLQESTEQIKEVKQYHLQDIFKDSKSFEIAVDLFNYLDITDDSGKTKIGERGAGILIAAIKAIIEYKLLNHKRIYTLDNTYTIFQQFLGLNYLSAPDTDSSRYRTNIVKARAYLKEVL